MPRVGFEPAIAADRAATGIGSEVAIYPSKQIKWQYYPVNSVITLKVHKNNQY
jgi:hypothetical protein